MGASNYVKVVREFAPAMKKRDFIIQIIACGRGVIAMQAWNAQVLAECADCFDYLSIHYYEKPDRYAEGPGDSALFWHQIGKLIAASNNLRIKLFVSEWNAQSIDWRTGLYCAGILNEFEKASDLVAMATPALWLRHVSATDWNNAFINFNHCTWFPAPNYVVMKLWRDHFAPNLLTLEGNPGPLNITATKGAELILKAVNPSTNAVPVVLSVKSGYKFSQAEFLLINPGSLQALNSLNEPHRVHPAPAALTIQGQSVRFTMPPFSTGVVTIK